MKEEDILTIIVSCSDDTLLKREDGVTNRYEINSDIIIDSGPCPDGRW